MAIGTYGVTRPADVNIDDIDIYYNYASNRNVAGGTFTKIENANDLLSYSEDDDGDLLGGVYDLTLPATIFNNLGIYNIYIKPKVTTTTINDCSVLASLPSVRGVVLNINDLPTNLTSNNALQGFRVEYLNDDGSKLRNVVRYIVTSNKVNVSENNNGDLTQTSKRYRFDDNGSLLFLQLTPSSSSDVKPNVRPFIGNPGQTIQISNTYFNPVMLEVEMVENTIDTLTNIVAGEQIKDVSNGILTHYDENREIFRQFELYQIKDDVTKKPLYEVKERLTNVDTTQDFDDITDDVDI
ncbi:MAG: hypothetical protein ACOC2W_02785 [bacterium]